MSPPNFYLGCESQEMTLSRLKNITKFTLANSCCEAWSDLRNCSIEPEQSALCRGIQGPWTETPANWLTRGGTLGKTSEAVGTSASQTFGHCPAICMSMTEPTLLALTVRKYSVNRACLGDHISKRHWIFVEMRLKSWHDEVPTPHLSELSALSGVLLSHPGCSPLADRNRLPETPET